MTEKRPSWDVVPFGSLAEFRNGVNFTKKNFGRGMKVINVKDFQDYFKPLYAELDEINPEGVVRDNDILQDEDILFVRSNGNRELIGRSLFIKGASERVTHSAFTIRARIQSREAMPLFYAYALRTDLVRRALSAHGGGTNINNLNQGILSALQVPKPPLPTQQKIAAVLSAYDELIENNTRRVKLLEQMAQALYRDRFVRPRQSGKLPNGWREVRVGDRFKTLLGGTPSRRKSEFWAGGTIPWINSGKVNEFRILEASEFITPAGLEGSSTKVMPRRTTVIAITGATLGQVSLTEIEVCANQSVVGVIDTEKLYSEYLYLTFKEIIRAVIQHASGGAQQHINKEIISDVKILLPSADVLQRFNDFAVPAFDQIANLLRKNTNLRRARDLLLPELISGEIDLPRLNILPEPAADA